MSTKSFIKTIGSKGLLADYNTEGKKLQTEDSIDQTYSSTSTKAQSGVAVNEAFKTRETSGRYDSYTYLGMIKTYHDTEYLYWKLVSFKPTSNYWSLQFEIDVSNGRKGDTSFDTEIYETKRLTIYGGNKDSVNNAIELRYISQSNNDSRGYGNNIYYEIDSSKTVTIYIYAKRTANTSQICRLKDVINLQSISNITWHEAAIDAGTQPTNPIKFKEEFPAIASVKSNLGSESVPVYVNNGKPVSCNSSNLKAGKDDDGNVIKNTYQKKLTFDTAPTAGSSNPVTSDGIKTALELKADKYVYKDFDFGDWELGAVSSSGNPVARTTRIRTALISVGSVSKHISVNIPSGYYMMMACTNTLYKIDWTTGNNKEFVLPASQSVRFAIKKSDESDLTYDTPNNIFNSSGIACVGDKTYNLSDVLKMAEAATGKEIINPVATDSSLLSDIVFKRVKTWRYVNALQKRCYSLHTKNLGAKYSLSNEFLLHSYSSGNSFSINSNGEAVITSTLANAESSLHIGGFNPYYFYELDCNFGAGKTAGIEFPNEDFSDIIRVTCEGTAIRVVRIVSGVETELATFTASETPERLYVHYNGLNVNISVGYGNTFAYLGYAECDMRAFSDYKSRRFGVYAKLDASENIIIKDVWGGISSGTGQADPVVCHRKNGEPYVKNGKLYLTMTFRGYKDPIMSGACICTLDIDTYELEIIGHLYGVTAGDKLYHMTNSCFLYNDDENAFYFFGLIFDLNNHYEYYAKLEEQDIGSSLYLQYINLGLGVNKESFDVVYDAALKKWTALYCDLADDYKTKLAYSDELIGAYNVQASTTATNTTASRWVVVGSTKKVVMGGDLQTMAIYDDQLTYEGEMNVPEKLNGNRMWCTVIPVRVGNFTKYLMLSFDRGNFSGPYSYGTSGVFESDIIKKGSEYEYIG